MALFMVLAQDRPDVLARRLALRPQHLARLQALHANGQLVLAGPLPTDFSDPPTGITGSLMVLDFATREALDAWLSQDPFVTNGIYESVDVRPFKQALP